MQGSPLDKTVPLDGSAGKPGEAFDAGGRFVLERALGSGAMGTAWLARDNVLLRYCVIKVLHAAARYDGIAVQRFLHEARLTARLRHPHVVTTYDLGVAPSGVPFLVLEQLVGRPLDNVLEVDGPMRPARCVAIAIQVLRALDAAHAAGVVHHDVKPANVFVERSGVVGSLRRAARARRPRGRGGRRCASDRASFRPRSGAEWRFAHRRADESRPFTAYDGDGGRGLADAR